MVLLKLKAREEQGKEENKVHLVTCNQHKVMCNSTMKSANQDLTPSVLRVLDQIVYRFGKLQDSMGEKVLPLILEMTEDSLPLNATFSEKLNRLERIGAIPDVQAWKRFRAIRNALAHEYPDDPELRMSAINRFVKGAEDFSMLYQSVKEYISDYFSKVSF